MTGRKCAPHHYRPEPALLEHPRATPDRDRELDRANLPPAPPTGVPGPVDPDRIRHNHEHASRPGCLTRTCHRTVQQTRIYAGVGDGAVLRRLLIALTAISAPAPSTGTKKMRASQKTASKAGIPWTIARTITTIATPKNTVATIAATSNIECAAAGITGFTAPLNWAPCNSTPSESSSNYLALSLSTLWCS